MFSSPWQFLSAPPDQQLIFRLAVVPAVKGRTLLGRGKFRIG
jgi:hypothetical protein